MANTESPGSNRMSRGHTSIYLGDAMSVLRDEIADCSVQLIFADPPYNIGKRLANFRDQWPTTEAYIQWCREWLDLCISKLDRTGSLYVMCSTQSAPYFDLFLRERMFVLSRIIWHYDSSGVQAKRYFGSTYEPIFHCVRNKQRYTFNAEDILVKTNTGANRKLIDYRGQYAKPYSHDKVPGNVWEFPRVRYRMSEYENHPTQKPEALLERIIRASSNPGDLVMDPFSGTFTTSAVAQRLGRASIGIELQEEFFKIGVRRLGIADGYKDELLQKPVKTYKRRQSAPSGGKLL